MLRPAPAPERMPGDWVPRRLADLRTRSEPDAQSQLNKARQAYTLALPEPVAAEACLERVKTVPVECVEELSVGPGKTRIEIWDADDFDPWETLQWETVRVLRYRQHNPDATVVQADWFTNFSKRKVVSLALYRMAKSRWEIENQGFNDCKTYQGLEHICHHHPNSLLLCWLLTLLALVISRLYRLRYLHRGRHEVMSACDLVRLLWLDLGGPVPRESG